MGQKKKVSRRAGSFPVEFRIRVVKLFLEEGYSASMLAEEFGCGKKKERTNGYNRDANINKLALMPQRGGYWIEIRNVPCGGTSITFRLLLPLRFALLPTFVGLCDLGLVPFFEVPLQGTIHAGYMIPAALPRATVNIPFREA